MNSFCHLTITPISRNPKSNSFIDYKEQLKRVNKLELIWCWDDSRFNKAKKGELFAFYFHEIRVIIHKIVDVKPPSDRLPSWSKNVGQGDRNVLELSGPLKDISWSEWQFVNGPESKMGTYTTNDLSIERPNLYQLLLSIDENNLCNLSTNDSPKNSINSSLEVEEETSEDEFNEERINEEKLQLLKRLKEIEIMEQNNYLKIKRKEYIEKIKEIREEILSIDKLLENSI